MYGLYLITNDDPFELLLEKLQVALATKKVGLLQYRRKHIAKNDQYIEIEKVLLLCNRYDVPLIINDDLAQAKHFGVHLHLGQGDGEISIARALLGQDSIIGRTCHNSIELAQQAIFEGASYIAFGAIYATSTKPEAGHIGLDALREASQRFNVPICAIGGLTVENSKVVIASGADSCAVVSDILGLDIAHIAARTEAWAQLFSPSSQ